MKENNLLKKKTWDFGKWIKEEKLRIVNLEVQIVKVLEETQ
jgi:hypothetical protein